MTYPFKNNPTQKNNPIRIKKKKKRNQPELKLTQPTQIKLTLKLNSNSPQQTTIHVSLLSPSPSLPLSHLSLVTCLLNFMYYFFCVS